MTHVEFFPKVNDRSTHSVQPLIRLLEWATGNRTLKRNTLTYKQWLKDNPDAAKKEISEKKLFYFPAVVFSGTFKGTGKAEDLDRLSGLIVLDFDHLTDLASVKKTLENDPHTFLLFVSPSGDGLKVVAKHNLADPGEWQWLYVEFEKYYSDKFGLITDKSGKDISRMCFLPFIENLYRNDGCTVWHYTGLHKTRKETPLKEPQKTDADCMPDAMVKECYYIAMYLYENKINMTEDYDDWISYGYSLCALGEEGRRVFHAISSVSEKYDFEDCDRTYDYMIDHYDEGRTDIGNFIDNGKRAIAHHALFKKYGFQCA